MSLATYEPRNLVLRASWTEPRGAEPAWFGALQVKKSYVSCHLMPLYALPSLNKTVPPELRRRMQGKSCFNFRKVEADLFDALEHVIGRCAEAYAQPVTPTPHS